jgi:hypothetical protein
MRTITAYSRTALLVALTTSLLACGGADETQDGPILNNNESPQINNSTIIAGVAMDGFVASGLVWLDIKENDTLDGTEPVAYTDSQGYFSYNPNTGVNYCTSQLPNLQQHCLQTGLAKGKVEIKIAKGIKLLTGVPFQNVMSAELDLQSANNMLNDLMALGPKPSGATELWQQQVDSSLFTLSPLGTLFHKLPEDINILDALSLLGYEFSADTDIPELLKMNYVEGFLLDTPQAADLLYVNVMISGLVNTLTGTYDLAFENVDLGFDGYPISTADSVYQGLADAINIALQEQSGSQAASHSHMDSVYTGTSSAKNEQFIELFRTQVDQRLRKLSSVDSPMDITPIISRNFDRISSMTEFSSILNNRLSFTAFNSLSRINSLSASEHLNFAVTPNDFLDNIGVINPTNSNTGLAETLEQASAVIKRISTDDLGASQGVSNSDFTDSFRLFGGRENILSSTSSINIDLKRLGNDVQKNADINTISASEYTMSSFSSGLSGNYLSLSGLQDGGEQGQVVVFFDGDLEDTSGSLAMCIAYSSADDPSDNISGQRFDGSWNIIGDAQYTVSLIAEGFTLSMNIAGETRGSDIPVEQQVPSLQRNPNELYGKFSFTLNEDSATWHSDTPSINESYGFLNIESVPLSDAECAEFLALQIE